ncbi:MAG TPA: M28 family peptidase, partial [Bacteroidia bacterium]|nr:M28 family peptidase [Bacteroidia bacterium]
SSTPGVHIVTTDFLFVGYGIDDEKYSDYKNPDPSVYKDKVLIMLDGEPSNGVYRISGTDKPSVWTTQRRAKLNAAKKYNARAILIVPLDFAKSRDFAKHHIEGYSLLLDEPGISADAPTPVIYVKDSLVNTIFALGNAPQKNYTNYIAEWRQAINSTGLSQSVLVKTHGNILITRKEEKLITENVLGYVEGTDLKDQLIVVTAHYDHLGKHDGVVYNGADDDGSGTVAVMEMAEAFMKAKQDGHGPRRSMLFMTVSGEEKGLLGSAWYANHPVYPLEKTMCDLNIDMIGRVDDEHKNDSNFVYVIGSDKLSKDLKKITEAANKKYCHLKLDYRYDDPKDPNMFYYRSDHYNFAKNGIPVAFFFNGVHADYHKETDEVSKINFSLMQKRTRLVFHTAWELANRDKPIKLNEAKK